MKPTAPEASSACLPRHPAVAYLFLVRCCANSLIALLIVTGYELASPCSYAFNASFTRQTVDTPLPAIFAALWIECPPFNKRTMAHNT